MMATLLAASLAIAAPPTEAEQIALWASDRDARMAWWRDAHFGMFIHWGLYSPAGGFWDGKRYEQHYAEWIQHWAAVPCAEYARQFLAHRVIAPLSGHGLDSVTARQHMDEAINHFVARFAMVGDAIAPFLAGR